MTTTIETDIKYKRMAQLADIIGKYACTEKNPCGVIFGQRDGRYFIADDHVSQSCDTFDDLLTQAQDWFEDFAANDVVSRKC